MTVAPIRKSVVVKSPPARTFELFASRISEWWPAGRTPGRNQHAAIIVEPFAQGRWFERDADGQETQWGSVLEWSPPSRLLLAWQLAWQPGGKFTYDPALITRVELTFAPNNEGGTIVTLEHRDLERLGADALAAVERINGGWAARIEEFREFAEAQPVNASRM